MPPIRRRGRGPARFRGGFYAGGRQQTGPLPLVSAVGVTDLEPTTATLIGSLNPQGLAGSYWFVWGTTPEFGNSTSIGTIGPVTIPQTFLAPITGLTTGTLYYFAFVGSTSAGTVTSSLIEFTPAIPTPVPDANNPVIPTAVPAVAVPHFYFPYTIQNSAAIVVEQDSLQEVTACVQTIVNCQVGECPELPTFGIPDLTFQTAPPSPNAIVQAIQQLEPRANETTIVTALDDTGANWGIRLETSTSGTGQ